MFIMDLFSRLFAPTHVSEPIIVPNPKVEVIQELIQELMPSEGYPQAIVENGKRKCVKCGYDHFATKDKRKGFYICRNCGQIHSHTEVK